MSVNLEWFAATKPDSKHAERVATHQPERAGELVVAMRATDDERLHGWADYLDGALSGRR